MSKASLKALQMAENLDFVFYILDRVLAGSQVRYYIVGEIN